MFRRAMPAALNGEEWLAALVRFAQRDVPVTLARTDPALYRRLREPITRFFLLGGDAFVLTQIRSWT